MKKSLNEPNIIILTSRLNPWNRIRSYSNCRFLKSRIKILKFALTHSAGFVIIALPIVFLIGDNRILYIISNIIGIIFAILLLIETITGKEFDIGPNKAGLLQGAFVITPTKVLT
ncbi:MAG: hypothetical protein QXE59_05655 [Saccharolobus sp.]